MSLEGYIGIDADQPMSEGALEQLREKMRAAQAQIAGIKKEERKHKKKEHELHKILMKFVQTSQKKELVLLISRVLEKNVPANFVLAIILLGNEDVQRAVGNYLMLQQPDEKMVQSDGKALIFFGEEDSSLPLKVKIEVDNWIKGMMFQAGETPQKLVKTAYKREMIELPKEYDFDDTKYKEKKTVRSQIFRLMAFVLRDFMEQHKVDQEYEQLKGFSKFILEGIVKKTEEMLDSMEFLEGDTAD